MKDGFVRLGELIQERSIKNKENLEIPVYSVTNSKGFCTEYFSKDVSSKDKTSYKIVRLGDFAYNPSRINVGSVDWQRYQKKVIVSPIYVVFSVCENIDQQFLYYYLKSDKINFFINQLSCGSVRSNLSFTLLSKLPFPKIQKKEQQKIAQIMDRASYLIDLRISQINKLDELIKSRFMEMFGELNIKHNQCAELGKIAEITSGITKGRAVNNLPLIEVPYMAVSNVKEGYIDRTTIKTIFATKQEIERYKLLPYDVLMTEGGDPDKLGRGAIITEPPDNCIHQNHIFRIRLNRDIVHPIFYSEYLQTRNAKCYFLRCAKQTTGIATINMRQLNALPVPLPPLPLQQQFAAFVEKVDKSKLAVKQSLEKLETLKKSLMQQYFG